ncbi:T9SS type A sorting domain-containing protein [uncultured Pontibacter sp.]|uniref:T9SS type A sorting domain-containing protein n=1 Tax=uncultured Pontibacter sp. TaxID=453356 RepID=UPI002608A3E9|nr:T9SS type A sorting domain-containing protein [uncultured Pontibacter sp.]
MKTFYFKQTFPLGQLSACYKQVLSLTLLFIFSYQLQAQTIEWDRTYGGEETESFAEVQQTVDGGYILGGTSRSGVSGDKSEPNRGVTEPFNLRTADYWIVKLDAEGNKVWDKTFGGSDQDELTSLQQTSDGGYILGGTSWSGISGDKTEANVGDTDYWIVKVDANGNKEWDRTYGGEGRDFLYSLQQTEDGGYVLGGSSWSDISGDKTEASRWSDYWIIKIDAAGNKVWDKTYGGDFLERLYVVRQTQDGGYIIGGHSTSNASGDKSEDNRGICDEFVTRDCPSDYWVVKTDANGMIEWEKTMGGISTDILTSLVQTSDGGYVFGGYSYSNASGEKSENNRAGCDRYDDDICSPDFWVVKTDATGSIEWEKTIGGVKHDRLNDLIQTSDGGYLLGGSSTSPVSGDRTEGSDAFCDYEEENICSPSYWLVKLNGTGDKLWDRAYEGNRSDRLMSLQQTSDGGYILGGESTSGISGDKSEASRGSSDYWVIKLSPEADCVTPTPAIAVRTLSDVYTGGDSSTIYLGYGAQQVQLIATGGTTYTWSPADGLSNASIADPVFTPSSAGTYIFTVTAYNGSCSATATVTITVIDVRCGNGKIAICHNGQQLCLPAPAIESHLRNHRDDKLGRCNDTPAHASALRVHPNPFSTGAKITFSIPIQGNYRLELYSANGEMLGVVAEGKAKAGQLLNKTIQAEKLREGVYYLRLISANDVQTTRLVLKK